MKHTFRRMTALFLVLLMTASLLASCSKGHEEADGAADTYLGENVDLGLAENETLMDIIEVDGELRATVGVTSDEQKSKYGDKEAHGIPYQTEYRYYSLDLVEDTAKRENTVSFHEIAQLGDTSENLTLGGTPYCDEEGTYTGVLYHLYQDGESKEEVISPNAKKWEKYSSTAQIILNENMVYASINYQDGNGCRIFVNDHFLQKPDANSDILYGIYGMMEVDGIPYALIHVAEYDWSGFYFVDPVWEATRLVPLTQKMTQLSLEGKEIEGDPTGGAFSDGEYGYYMCGSELWRTDGKSGYRISDLIYYGVNAYSDVRTVRTLADGRILMVVDGRLIELSESNHVVPAERNVYTIGVVNYTNSIDDLSVTVAKFNSNSGSNKFAIKEYKNVAKMNLALLSGEVDMIVTNDHFMLKNYVKQGLLASLEEVAPELFEKDVLIENIVDATRVNGTCYFLPRGFAIWGRVIESRLLEEGQTFETSQEYYGFIREKTPGYLKANEKKFILEHLAPTLDEWIDWESNTCHFDDGTFEATLAFCNEAETTIEVFDDTMVSYTDLCCVNNICPEIYFTDVITAKAYLEEHVEGDPEVLPVSRDDIWAWVCLPLPSTVHDGYEIKEDHYFAVVDKEESRKAAQEFLSYHFIEDVVGEIAPDDPNAYYPDWAEKGVWTLSINQAECERIVSRNLCWDGDDKETRLPIEQRRYEDTWKMIRQANHLTYYRNAVFDVMVEEAYRYFAGDITAKQAAEYVQNRISIYLAEQG